MACGRASRKVHLFATLQDAAEEQQQPVACAQQQRFATGGSPCRRTDPGHAHDERVCSCSVVSTLHADPSTHTSSITALHTEHSWFLQAAASPPLSAALFCQQGCAQQPAQLAHGRAAQAPPHAVIRGAVVCGQQPDKRQPPVRGHRNRRGARGVYSLRVNCFPLPAAKGCWYPA